MKKPNPGKTLFIEDIASGVTIGQGEKCWVRQLNPESPDRVIIQDDGGLVWVLGLKTEGRASHVVATNGAKVEILGGASYQSWTNQKLDPPMFSFTDSEGSFVLGYYTYKQPFTTIVEETHGSQKRTLERHDNKSTTPLHSTGPTR